jgi:hypothetical protein
MVLRHIDEQEIILAALEQIPDHHRGDYLHDLCMARNKIRRSKQELSVLESGRLLKM